MGRWGRWTAGVAIAVCAAGAMWLLLTAVSDGWGQADPVASVFGGLAGISALAITLRQGNGARDAGESDPPPPAAQGVPDWVVNRNEVDQVVAAVCRRDGQGAVGITTGLQGAGGFGKTTLALMVCAHPKVRQHFRERIYVVKVGRDVRGRAAVAAKVAEATRFITGDTLEVGTDPDKAGDHLGRLLSRRPPTLLVIDDVWEPEQLDPFLRGASDRCVRLVTTRRPSMLPPSATHIKVDRMSPEQARAVLTHGLRPSLPQELVDDLVRATGRWALLLRLINQVIAAQVSTGADTTAAGEAVLERLRDAGPAGEDPQGFLDLDDPDRRNTAVRASIRAATTLLPSEGDRRFAELGVFAEDEAIPLPVIALLWRVTGGLDEARSRLLCKQMADLSLLTIDAGVPGGAVALHDVVRDYLRAELASDVPAVNAALLSAIAATLPPDPAAGAAWWESSEGYVQDHLIEHLVDAGHTVQAEAAAGSLLWVRARLHQRGPTAICRDLERIGTRTALSLSRQLARAAHLLSPTSPSHALDAILCSRITDAPHWDPAALLAVAPALVNRWSPPDLPDPALIRTLTGHTEYVNSVGAGPDGAWIATAGNDKSVRIWDPATGTTLRSLRGHTGWVTGVAISPDGTWLATTGDEGTIRLWNPAAGTALRTLDGHTAAVNAAAVSHDGSWLASASNDKTVRIWDPATGRLLRTLEGHTGWVTDVAISPDGTWLAGAGNDRTLRIWDPATGSLLRTLEGHTAAVNAVASGSDGTWLATASGDRTVRVWDPATGTLLRTLTGHTDWIRALTVSPDGSRIASGSDDKTVRIWDPATGESLRTLTGHTGAVNAVAFSPDGTWLATAGNDRSIRMWDPATGTPIETLTGRAGAITTVAAGARGILATTGEDGIVRSWDASTGTCVDTWTGHTGAVNAVVFSPDEVYLATAGDDDTIRLWLTYAGSAVRTLTGHTSAVKSVAYHPDGTLLVSGGDDGVVRLWDPATGDSVHRFWGHRGAVNAVAFSPDGSWFVTAGEDATVRLWDPDTGSHEQLQTGHVGSVEVLIVGANGRQIITAGDDGTVRIWDMATSTVTRTLRGHGGAVTSVAMSSDGARIATTSIDGALLVWEAGSDEPLTMMRTDSRLMSCAWSRDGYALFAGGGEGLFCYDFQAGSPTV
ncbi:NB-ARC domain-containing protein [Streptomyces sp. NPDC048338]|uniref:NB-ARC domain-containing protein n=1 Tax=Streptomyces sp. NPDC048338 TaxID=3365536 RepID=UPI00371121F7